MKAVLVPSPRPHRCELLTTGRNLGDCMVANRPLAERQRAALAAAGLTVVAEPPAEPCLRMAENAWLSATTISELVARGGAAQAVDGDRALAWIGGETAVGERVPVDDASFAIVHPWDLLRLNEQLVAELNADDLAGDIDAGIARIGGFLAVGPGTRILPGVVVEGNAVIGRDCKIGPNCYIRGATSIGDGCHVGQAVEIKNSLVMGGCSIAHLSYCGDSVIGERVNFGAGTIVSNFRHDGANHRSMVDDQLVDTGRRKFGAIVGDDVHTGIHTSIYPGRKLWPGVSTRPGAIVHHDLRPDTAG